MEIKDKKALAQSFIIHCKDKERRSSLPSLTVERLHCTRVTIFAGDSNPLTAMFFVPNETKFGKNWTLLSNNVNTTIRKHSLWAFIFRVVMSLGFDVKCRAVIKFLISCNLCTYTRNNLQVSWEYNVQWWLATPVTPLSSTVTGVTGYGPSWQPWSVFSLGFVGQVRI